MRCFIAPRNAGILGVPNASGPMSDPEGRKRRRVAELILGCSTKLVGG